MSVLIVGSTGLDDIETLQSKVYRVMGGSAFYASVAASFFCPTRLVGIVGDDLPQEHLNFLKSRKIDLSGLQIVKGEKTFHWSGIYEENFSKRRTISLSLNVFEKFNPRLNDRFRETAYIFLANIDPHLQLSVLNQLRSPRLVVGDTMNHWIFDKKEKVTELMQRVDIMILNDEEVKDYTGESSLWKAGQKILKIGPRFVIIKKGEHGAVMLGKNSVFFAPAFPVENVCDPTGAGDVFAGSFTAYLARRNNFSWTNLKKAVIYGTVMASLNVEKFSVTALKNINFKLIQNRFKFLKKNTAF